MVRAPLAQLDRASGYEPGGRRFESCRARQILSHQQLAGWPLSSDLLVKNKHSRDRVRQYAFPVPVTAQVTCTDSFRTLRWPELGPLGPTTRSIDIKWPPLGCDSRSELGVSLTVRRWGSAHGRTHGRSNLIDPISDDADRQTTGRLSRLDEQHPRAVGGDVVEELRPRHHVASGVEPRLRFVEREVGAG